VVLHEVVVEQPEVLGERWQLECDGSLYVQLLYR
jgi:hypothetical protein